MAVEHHPMQETPKGKKIRQILSKIIVITLFVIVGYYLLTEHRAHVFSFLGAYWWLLIVLLCPLMHLLHGHGGHGGCHGHQNSQHKNIDTNSSEKKD